jgi:RNAse (barnase) inhibitor barstar
MKKMREDLRQDGLLAPNFIAELVESARSLAALARGRIRKLETRKGKELINRVKDAMLGPKRQKPKKAESLLGLLNKTGSQLRKDVAKGGTLAAKANIVLQFVVGPTIQDAMGLWKAIADHKSKLSKLIEKAGRRRSAHYGRPVDGLFELPPPATWSTTFTCGMGHTYERFAEYITRPIYHASMVYTYNASRLQHMLGYLDGFLHASGVDRPLSIAWEAMPFSFVVDWFVSVGEFIEAFEDQINDPLPIVVHDFSHSLKWCYRTRIYSEHGNARLPLNLAFGERSYYERRRDLPSLWDALSVRLPSLNQAGLGLSLIILKLDGITHRRSRR